MTKQIKHNTFDEIENRLLQSYNRAVMCSNLLEQYNEEECEKYLEQFTVNQKAAIQAILVAIRIYGVDAVTQKVLQRAEEIA